MINVKKGSAHSLTQTDLKGKVKASEGVVAGMLVNINAAGEVIKGVTSQGVADLLGFAINNQTDGDAVESGKIGAYALDGGSIIETDQVTEAINASNYAVGVRLAGDLATGKVKAWATGDRVVGYVEGIRNLQSTQNLTQSYVDVNGATQSSTRTVQTVIPLLSIKLAA